MSDRDEIHARLAHAVKRLAGAAGRVDGGPVVVGVTSPAGYRSRCKSAIDDLEAFADAAEAGQIIMPRVTVAQPIDTLRAWLAARVDRDPSSTRYTRTADLFSDYFGFAVAARKAPFSIKRFSLALQGMGFSHTRHPGSRRAVFRGLWLNGTHV